jgi:hypothetical protein
MSAVESQTASKIILHVPHFPDHPDDRKHRGMGHDQQQVVEVVAYGLQHHVLINGVYCLKFVLKQNLVVSNEKILNHTMEETTKKNILILV